MTNTDPRILIAGAGPSGLILALALCRNGVPVRVIDKLATPALGQRGPGITEILRTLGVLDDVNKVAISPVPIRTYALPEGTVPLKIINMTTPLDLTPTYPFRDFILIGQNRLEAILRAALQAYSCEVEFGTSLASFIQDTNGVDATIVKGDGHEEVQRFDFLVGADGARGVVRKQLGLTFLGESRPELHAIIGDVRVEGLGQDASIFFYWHMWGELTSNSGCVFLRPTGEPGLFGLIMSLSGLGLDDEAVMNDRAAFQDALTTITGRKDLKILELVWVAHWSPNIRMTEKFSSGRCFLAGDAAHVHSPTGGQGLNSGAQDSFNLAWKLALVVNGHAPMTLLDSYDEERALVIKEMLHKTTSLLNLTTSSSQDDSSRWDRGGPLLMLGVNYRWSTIVLDEQVEKNTVTAPKDPYGVQIQGLKAGDRAPDASELKDIRGGGPSSVRLFDVFDLSRHTVLIFNASPDTYNAVLAQISRYPQGLVRCVVVVCRGVLGAGIKGSEMVLEDMMGHAYGSYHFEGGCNIVAVRPDGILGAVVRSPEAIGRYFSQIFAL
ncbi:Pentachlorophenol 4-monooxygenase [Mycena venus]|uniref:Pentachlorophenol 4-monooxygenase n=1 Tax=Mycena venus TaxID=2733690 RepID=A0A8H6YDQ1_9AGAR|nr:Pentachlorophenol 4-monooxygenase [Mycena venus]